MGIPKRKGPATVLTIEELEQWENAVCDDCGTGMTLLVAGNSDTVGNTERCACYIESSIVPTDACEHCGDGDEVTLLEVWEPINDDENYRWYRAFCVWCDAERSKYERDYQRA